MGDLTAHFSRREFACRGEGCCGGSAPVHLELVEALEELRSVLGAPIRVTSGFRCVTHNRLIGGVDYSQHLLGLAADIQVEGWRPEQIINKAIALERFRGLGLYRRFVHLDMRSGPISSWTNYDAGSWEGDGQAG